MFDTQAVQESFSRSAAQYDAHAHLQREVRTYCLQMARQHWPESGHMLDAGCGTGALQQEVRASGLAWNISGVDISAGMCRQAARQRMRAASATVEALPFADGSFDGVFSSLMLQWVNDLPSAWAEMARVLKQGGCAIIGTLATGTLQELQQAFSSVDAAPHVSHFHDVSHLLAGAREAGLSLVLARQVRLVEYYPDAIALMRSLQSIGASNKHAKRRRGMMTPSQFTRLEKAYTRLFATPQGLPASWQVLSLVLRKE